jgi:TolA-binding protein
MRETSQARQALDKLAGEFSSEPGLAGAFLSIAEIYRKAKKYEEAKSIYETVVTNYPGTERALKAQKKLAIVYIDVDDDPNAQQAIDRLSQDFSGDPNLADALYEIAKRFEWVRGKYEQAAPIYQQIVQSFPDSSYAKEKLDLSRTNIIYLIESGNYTLAAEALSNLLSDFSQHPDLAWTLDGIAGRYEKSKRYDEARSIYRKIVTDYNETDYAFTAQKKLTILEIKSGDYTAAQAMLDILIADFNDQPGLPEAVFIVGEQYYYKAFDDNKKCIKVKYQEYLYKAKDIWERILAQWPESSSIGLKHAQYFTAVCYRRFGEYEKAITHYQKVVDNWPDYQYAWSAQYLIGSCYEKLKYYNSLPESEADPKIEQAYKSVVENYPDSAMVPSASLKLGYLDLKRGQKIEAAIYFELFLATARPNDPRIERVEIQLEELKG